MGYEEEDGMYWDYWRDLFLNFQLGMSRTIYKS